MDEERDEDDVFLARDEGVVPVLRTSYRLRDTDIGEIIRLFRRYARQGYGVTEATDRIAKHMGVSTETVRRIRRRFLTTRLAAHAYLGANALKLAMRVVRDANVEESIQVLSNPKVGVLEPDARGGSGSGPSFVIGVSMDSLGAVQVSAVVGQPPPAASSSAPLVHEGPPQPVVMDIPPLPRKEPPVIDGYAPDPEKWRERQAKRGVQRRQRWKKAMPRTEEAKGG